MPNLTMSTPVGTRVSMRANKVTLKPGTYVSDGNNLFMLEDSGITSSKRNMPTAYPIWQQNYNQTWLPDTAYVRHQAPWCGHPPTGTPAWSASRGT